MSRLFPGTLRPVVAEPTEILWAASLSETGLGRAFSVSEMVEMADLYTLW